MHQATSLDAEHLRPAQTGLRSQSSLGFRLSMRMSCQADADRHCLQAPWVPPIWQPCEDGTPQIPDTLPFKPEPAGRGRGQGRGRGRGRSLPAHGSAPSSSMHDPGNTPEAAAPSRSSRRVRQRRLPPSAWEHGHDWDDAIPTL